MSQPALFDLELTATARPESGIVHVLMPCMVHACGRGVIEAADAGDRFTVGTNADRWNEITCPDCRAIGLDGIRAETRREQGHQEVAS